MKLLYGIIVLSLLVLSACSSAEERLVSCQSDADCVPEPGCHATKCINSQYLDNYDPPEACTTMFDCSAVYNEEDCSCQSNVCVNENSNGEGCEGI